MPIVLLWSTKALGFKWMPSALHVLGQQLYCMFSFLSITLYLHYSQLPTPKGLSKYTTTYQHTWMSESCKI